MTITGVIANLNYRGKVGLFAVVRWPRFRGEGCWTGGNVNNVLVDHVGELKRSSTLYVLLFFCLLSCLRLSFRCTLLLHLS
jgi:hypothetical protein